MYTNTLSVLGADWIIRAAGASRVVGVLLTATDATAATRLAGRELGTGLDRHVAHSAAAARELDATAPPWVQRVPADGRAVPDIANDVIACTGWLR